MPTSLAGFVAAPGRQKYQRERLAERRGAWLREHGPCVRCGSWNRLEVDHVDPAAKRAEANDLWKLALDNPKRIAELAKCQALCHDCHAEKTLADRGRVAVHGARSMYVNHGCRCRPCRDAVRDYRRGQVAATRAKL